MIGPPIALAKIQPPRLAADLVERARLEAALSEAIVAFRVTLLVAPAGYGKTMALVRALMQLPVSSARAWISVDSDDDAQRLMACLLAALEPYDLPWRSAPESLIAAMAGDDDAQRKALVTFVNTLAASEVERGVIALDDLHQIADAPTMEWLAQLAQWLPANWALAVASRVDPPLPVALWRARGELAELRAVDLRFTPAEVAALMNADLEDDRVRDLVERTDGWAAGLRLSLGRSDPRGAVLSRRHMFDYLAEEVLNALPAELRSFLLRTSVLPELTAARAASVSGDAHSARHIEEIESRGLFASRLESDEPTLRVHDLFRDFLQERLSRELAEETPELLQRAAADEGDPVRRIGWLLQAGALAEAQQALAQYAPAMLTAGADATLLRLLEQFPPALRESSPALASARGLVAFQRYEWVTMQRSMRRAAEGFAACGCEAQARQVGALEVVALTTCGRLAEASARLAELRAQPLERDTEALVELMACWETGARGPREAPAKHLSRMTDLLMAGAPPHVWIGCAPHFMFIGRPGVLDALERWAGQALAVAGEAHPMLRAASNAISAWVQLWRGEVLKSGALIESVEQDLRWLGRPRGLHLLVLSHHGARNAVLGAREPTNAAFDALIEDVDRDPERRATWRGPYLVLAAQCAACVGDWERVLALVDALEKTAPDREWPWMRGARRALAGQLALRAGRHEQAIEDLSDAIAGLAEVDLAGTEMIVRISLAQALLRSGRRAEAWDSIASAIERQEAGGAPFLFAGPDVLDELARADYKGAADDRAMSFLRGWAELARALRGAPPAERVESGSREAPGGLSRRELDVLGRIAAGDSNKVIARAFDLSPHTVKRHVANILDKLALDTRGQAASWYRMNGPH